MCYFSNEITCSNFFYIRQKFPCKTALAVMWTKARTGNSRKAEYKSGGGSERGSLSLPHCPPYLSVSRHPATVRGIHSPDAVSVIHTFKQQSTVVDIWRVFGGPILLEVAVFTYIIEIGFGRQIPDRARQTDTRPHRRESRKWPKYIRTFYHDHDC